VIAGHLFTIEGKCSCGKRFADISGATQEHIGKEGWAHTRELNAAEFSEICTERDRIWALVVGSSTGGAAPAVRELPAHDDAYFG